MRADEALQRIGSIETILARRGIELRRRVCRCPLHDDTHPSFSVYDGRDGKQRWKCFGCGRGGDALDLEAAFTGMTIAQLLEQLNTEAGL